MADDENIIVQIDNIIKDCEGQIKDLESIISNTNDTNIINKQKKY